ncbi:MAG: sulfate adenylyltransferase [Campylobacterales bacterium]
MASSKTATSNRRQLFIDIEAVATLAMVQKGLLSPLDGLMDSRTAAEVDQTALYKGRTFPFSFLLAPSGKRNAQVLKSAETGETLDLICEGRKRGELSVKEVFPIDPKARVYKIYGTTDTTHPGVENTMNRLGSLAVCGDYSVEFEEVDRTLQRVAEAKAAANAKHVTGLVMAARPLHRAHERVIRQCLDETDLLVIFLTKPYLKDVLPYGLRHACLDFFAKNFLPAHKVVIIPLENTYIFAGSNEMILNSIVVNNYGCDRFIVGQNHAGLGLHYSGGGMSTILDNLLGVDLEIKTTGEFVYCDLCKTLVTVQTCPHGHHHHITYHSDSILTLLMEGIVPPAVLMRKEISAMLLDKLFPARFKNLAKLYYDLIPSSGLIEEQGQQKFYMELMKLYQTSSLT